MDTLGIIDKEKKQLLMRKYPRCEDCPAAEYCKSLNMSCEECRLQVLGDC